MKNKVDTEGVVVFIVVAIMVLLFLLGLLLGLRISDNSSQEQTSDNSSQEEAQATESAEDIEDATLQPFGTEYQDKETGVCYIGLKDANGKLQVIAPRYNPDGSIMVKEVD